MLKRQPAMGRRTNSQVMAGDNQIPLGSSLGPGDAVRSRYFSTEKGQRQYRGLVKKIQGSQVWVKLIPRMGKRRTMILYSYDLTKIHYLDLIAETTG